MLHLLSPASRGVSSRDEDREALPEEPRKEINEDGGYRGMRMTWQQFMKEKNIQIINL